MDEAPSPYDRIITALGELCLMWSGIDNVIHDISLHLSVLLNPAFEPYGPEEPRPWHLLHLALGNMDERGRVATAKAYAHYASEWLAVALSPAEANRYYTQAEALLNYVDNVLRPERNRFVHDYWSIPGGTSVVRTKRGSQVRRPQSHQRVVEAETKRVYASLEQVEAFILNLNYAYGDLVELDNCASWMLALKEQPGRQPLQLPAEWQSLAHRGWRGEGKQFRPPRSSPG